jgi:hypothetical protein
MNFPGKIVTQRYAAKAWIAIKACDSTDLAMTPA